MIRSYPKSQKIHFKDLNVKWLISCFVVTEKAIPTEYDYYEHFCRTLENIVIGKRGKLLLLCEMVGNFAQESKRRLPKKVPKPYFTSEGREALMLLKMRTSKLMKQLGCYIHNQLFCGIHIKPERSIEGYNNLIDDILGKLPRKKRL